MSVTGLPGQGPVRVGVPIADLCGGIFAAYGVTVALLEREQSGKGQWLHTSLLEAMLYMMDFQASRWTLDDEIPGQAGNSHPTSIPTGVFKTSDGHINIAVFGGKIWERFAEALGARVDQRRAFQDQERTLCESRLAQRRNRAAIAASFE